MLEQLRGSPKSRQAYAATVTWRLPQIRFVQGNEVLGELRHSFTEVELA